MKGIIILDKPCGQSSHEITSWVKKISGSSRSGHAGTLDPEVSGVLPIALGKDTKLLRFIVAKEKTYVGIIKFKNPIKENEVKNLFKEFEGEIIQKPPKLSAVKKVKRKRTVYYLKFLEQKENRFLFETKVAAGTYIRTLCVDIGKKAKNPARMEELRRISVGTIDESQSFNMQEVIDAFWLSKEKNDNSLLKKILLPVENFLFYKKLVIKDSAANAIKSGAKLMAPGLVDAEKEIKEGELVKIYNESGIFVGMATSLYSTDELKKRKKGQIVKVERIHL